MEYSRTETKDMFEKIAGHEQVLFCNDPATGLQAIIAIHDTTLGPALGGTRMYPYESVDAALDDVLRLSEGMTHKCAASGLDFGGGKAVIIADPATDKSPALFRSFGQFVDSLNGRFYTGTDMGTTTEDFVEAFKETHFINGIPEEYGGSGDSSIPTAQGVLYALEATNEHLFNSRDLGKRSYAIQGLGKVGYKVAEQLLEAGAKLFVTDINEAAILSIENYASGTTGELKIVESDEIYGVEADIFVPCAMGGIINDETLKQLQVKAVVGSANNQLSDNSIAEKLQQSGILYAPDFIVNAGGLIQVADELYGPNPKRVLAKTKTIYQSLLKIYQQAEMDATTTTDAANQKVTHVLEEQKHRNNFFSRKRRPKWEVRE
ncbi:MULTISPECIES: Glu/Leu/Phe/Val dehydrogenase dimerization domain-containing protein [Salinicoccus]|uniref:NAD-specific glutamate dehydrogenase n=1 Tax=Salinicoccus roseus TaxID=45670 RepID=A0A0C2HFM4_9STAP|nr:MULTISPECIES: Glu/Leu/Phe/Val dehydrogenase dimerization domain-containing protein [Salinicoccus]KIH70449.1 leucine dehydrogenase [Salinicoccus roseus]MBY8909166.1 Glu/Leu/Phe/Val dehydrogenase [Salinicoccus roseus]MCC4722904.1 Glu/Leu/Phe/Val dehydrogenase [Salinicoccus sp. RF5]MDB0580839.1 Glu/Leu/Phe/Val dehydrogenase dimerization domain-containing protein [Salinicoccus roseus]OZT77716.1 Glu/Leu/Phe/Val dehydrogenase [Salinicoccus roseus]